MKVWVSRRIGKYRVGKTMDVQNAILLGAFGGGARLLYVGLAVFGLYLAATHEESPADKAKLAQGAAWGKCMHSFDYMSNNVSGNAYLIAVKKQEAMVLQKCGARP